MEMVSKSLVDFKGYLAPATELGHAGSGCPTVVADFLADFLSAFGAIPNSLLNGNRVTVRFLFTKWKGEPFLSIFGKAAFVLLLRLPRSGFFPF
jgi:hypothetical protein